MVNKALVASAVIFTTFAVMIVVTAQHRDMEETEKRNGIRQSTERQYPLVVTKREGRKFWSKVKDFNPFAKMFNLSAVILDGNKSNKTKLTFLPLATILFSGGYY